MASCLRGKAKCFTMVYKSYITWPTLLCRPHLLPLAHSSAAKLVSLQFLLQVFTQISSLSEAFPDHQILNGSLQTLSPHTPYLPCLTSFFSIILTTTEHTMSFIYFLFSLSPLQYKLQEDRDFRQFF